MGEEVAAPPLQNPLCSFGMTHGWMNGRTNSTSLNWGQESQSSFPASLLILCKLACQAVWLTEGQSWQCYLLGALADLLTRPAPCWVPPEPLYLMCFSESSIHCPYGPPMVQLLPIPLSLPGYLLPDMYSLTQPHYLPGQGTLPHWGESLPVTHINPEDPFSWCLHHNKSQLVASPKQALKAILV